MKCKTCSTSSAPGAPEYSPLQLVVCTAQSKCFLSHGNFSDVWSNTVPNMQLASTGHMVRSIIVRVHHTHAVTSIFIKMLMLGPPHSRSICTHTGANRNPGECECRLQAHAECHGMSVGIHSPSAPSSFMFHAADDESRIASIGLQRCVVKMEARSEGRMGGYGSTHDLS
jgi:hypothetical protein